MGISGVTITDFSGGSLLLIYYPLIHNRPLILFLLSRGWFQLAIPSRGHESVSVMGTEIGFMRMLFGLLPETKCFLPNPTT
mmetsp:Transcript_7003/g.14521  ORF Transcript_7003/g.14521 Transcript_7003/m.14521 type:complete len:81 (-) Transcript_7003:89-331(-)